MPSVFLFFTPIGNWGKYRDENGTIASLTIDSIFSERKEKHEKNAGELTEFGKTVHGTGNDGV